VLPKSGGRTSKADEPQSFYSKRWCSKQRAHRIIRTHRPRNVTRYNSRALAGWRPAACGIAAAGSCMLNEHRSASRRETCQVGSWRSGDKLLPQKILPTLTAYVAERTWRPSKDFSSARFIGTSGELKSAKRVNQATEGRLERDRWQVVASGSERCTGIGIAYALTRLSRGRRTSFTTSG